jgi:predicted phage tail protein
VSNEVRFDVSANAPPSAPVNFVGAAEGSRLVLNWTNTFNEGPVTGVRLLVTGAAETMLQVGRVTQFVFDGVPPGTYTFRVAAEGPAGPGTPSAPVTLTFPGACQRPEMPTWFTVGQVGTQLTLRWESGASGAAATDYEILLAGSPVIRTGGARQLSASVPPGRYPLSIRAVNSCGTSEATTVQTVVVP